jgi:hypothetical protein
VLVKKITELETPVVSGKRLGSRRVEDSKLDFFLTVQAELDVASTYLVSKEISASMWLSFTIFAI